MTTRTRGKPKRTMVALSLMPGDWELVKRELDLSPQQARIVALLLEGKKDKQIAAAMRLRFSTLRTYLSRIFVRSGSGDRVELVLRVFACVYAKRLDGRRRQD